jgi:hypothetical protein
MRQVYPGPYSLLRGPLKQKWSITVAAWVRLSWTETDGALVSYSPQTNHNNILRRWTWIRGMPVGARKAQRWHGETVTVIRHLVSRRQTLYKNACTSLHRLGPRIFPFRKRLIQRDSKALLVGGQLWVIFVGQFCPKFNLRPQVRKKLYLMESRSA